MDAISESFSAKMGEISAAELLNELDTQRGKRLIFGYEGRDVSPGYQSPPN